MSYSDGKIEVGMMVEIIDARAKAGPDAGKIGSHLGHVGRVLRPCSVYKDAWDIEGAETDFGGKLKSYASATLRPIQPPQELSSWEEIQKITKWNPQEVPA